MHRGHVHRFKGLVSVHTRMRFAVLTLIFTLICTVIPTLATYILLKKFYMPWPIISWCMTVIAITGFIMSAPTAIFALNMARLLQLTIGRVDYALRFDSLTGVATRASFLDDFRTASNKGGYALMLDADHFKMINDRFGHHVGDEALKIMARSMRAEVPGSFPVGRLGGEEFAIFLPVASDEQAMEIATAIRLAIQRNGVTIAERDVRMTVSIGMARCEPNESPEAALRKADAALYRAKADGRNRVAVAGSELPVLKTVEEVRRTLELRRAG